MSDDEIDKEQNDVDYYERQIRGPVPGRVYLEKANNSDSEWQDLSDSDSSAYDDDESIDISSYSSSHHDYHHPDYVERNRRVRRCTRKKSSNSLTNRKKNGPNSRKRFYKT
ncbi:hypothetical protein Fcan01_08842 [Folsomia candida]|uniref:Uncharacterized protein n=1 Tax=Folsomia candida TaxID=158441 RepID=A0A226EEM1_FOLCA|nr:hypothetical protein Fcan01_08842 [Folsomia candida]